MVVALIATIGVLSFAACNNKKLPSVDYKKNNEYSVSTTTYVVNPEAKEDEQLSAVIYTPDGVQAKYGLLFFLGTVIAPEYYDYLASALAKQGYVVTIVVEPFAYFGYDDRSKPIADKILAKYPDLKFFVGGHSQGGGAAMRFACENLDHVLGAIFLAPLTFGARDATQEEYDKDATAHPEWFNINTDGSISRADTLVNTTLPTLLLEASNDHVLSVQQKSEALDKMPQTMTHFVIQNASHMGFSTMELGLNGDGEDITEEDVANQQLLTVSYVLDFLQITVANL